MSEAGLDKLCEQDKVMVLSVMVENELYFDSLHNDAIRSFVFASDLRVVKCTWQYEGGHPKVKSAKSFTYDRIKRIKSQRESTSGDCFVILDSIDNENIQLVKMPEHFLKEVYEFTALVSDIVENLKSEAQTPLSNVGLIVANLDDLVKLAQLLQMGVITIDEFKEAKAIIMRRR